MKTYILSFVACVMMLVCTGCQTDDFAKSVVCYDTSYGRAMDLVSPASMIKQKEIDFARTIEAQDKTPLSVFVIKAKVEPASQQKNVLGTAIILHGLGESKTRFPYLGAGQVLSKKGYDVVLIDLRTHGHSGGKYITYGVKEKYDVKVVMDTLIQQGVVSDKIYVFGMTLGASVAIQYAAIDPRCKGVVAMTPYKDMESIARRLVPLTMSQQDFIKVLARAGEMAGINPAEASSVVAVKNVKCPILLIHGLVDLAVPYDQSEAILAAANEPKKLMAITPGPERLALAGLVLEDWIATKVDLMAQGKIIQAAQVAAPKDASQADEPAAKPVTPAPATAPAATKPVK